MQRIKSSKQQREHVCKILSSLYQGKVDGPSNDLTSHKELQVSHCGPSLFRFRLVDDNILVQYNCDTNEVVYIRVNNKRLSVDHPHYDRYSNFVYQLIDEMVIVNDDD